jgi:hypothetical protein
MEVQMNNPPNSAASAYIEPAVAWTAVDIAPEEQKVHPLWIATAELEMEPQRTRSRCDPRGPNCPIMAETTEEKDGVVKEAGSQAHRGDKGDSLANVFYG